MDGKSKKTCSRHLDGEKIARKHWRHCGKMFRSSTESNIFGELGD